MSATVEYTADVPCDGCTLCCQGDAIRLLPEDDANTYITEPHATLAGERMLAHKSNGDCIYLAEGGCSIHSRRPRMCREMDCRYLAQRISWVLAIDLAIQGRLPLAVWKRGHDLLIGE